MSTRARVTMTWMAHTGAGSAGTGGGAREPEARRGARGPGPHPALGARRSDDGQPVTQGHPGTPGGHAGGRGHRRRPRPADPDLLDRLGRRKVGTGAMSTPKQFSAYYVTWSDEPAIPVRSVLIDKGNLLDREWITINFKTDVTTSATGVRIARLCATC